MERNELLIETNGFDEANACWNNPDPEALVEDQFEGTVSLLLKPGSFSPAFTLDMDTIADYPLMLSAVCWLKGTGSGIKFVISLERNDKIFNWHGIDINDQIINQSEWNHVLNFLQINSHDDYKDTLMKVYLWNSGTEESLIDNIRISVSADTGLVNQAD